MFAVVDFPCQVLIHHDVIVPLQPHFMVPEEGSVGLKLKLSVLLAFVGICKYI